MRFARAGGGAAVGTEQRPTLSKVLDALVSVASFGLVAIALWRQFDPSFDPREFALELRDRLRAELEHRAAIYRQVREIQDLPEIEERGNP